MESMSELVTYKNAKLMFFSLFLFSEKIKKKNEMWLAEFLFRFGRLSLLLLLGPIDEK